MTITDKAEIVLEKAREIASYVDTWADFSLLIFDQDSGVITTVFQSEIERDAFFDSEEYATINQLQLDLMKKTGFLRGSKPRVPEKSGRFNVRVPKTLHQVLEIEAKREKVSLNQLIVSKLSIPLRSNLENEGKVSLVRAFADVHDGYGIDRIIVDPDYNPKFIRKCRELGLEMEPVTLNHTLMNVRKSKQLREQFGIEIPKTTRETKFTDFDCYQFASEIAVRVLQRTESVTLDRILCDPGLAKRFDEIALTLVNQTCLKLRWAALNLRKTRRLRPIKDLPADYDLVSNGPVKSVNMDSLTDDPGLYAIYDGKRPIFAGETEGLKERINLHVQYGIPCVNIKEDASVILKTFVAPGTKQQLRKEWLMAFVTNERPLLNYQCEQRLGRFAAA